MVSKISSMLDSISDCLEKRGLIKEAYEIDRAANTIDNLSTIREMEKTASLLGGDDNDFTVEEVESFIRNTYQSNKKIVTPHDVFLRYGETPSAKWIAKILNKPIEEVNKVISEQEQVLKDEKEKSIKDSKAYKEALKAKIMSGKDMEPNGAGLRALFQGGFYFPFEPWYIQKEKEILGKWYEYRNKIEDISSGTHDYYGVCNRKENWDWILECPFVAEYYKELVREQKERYERTRIKIGDILTGTLSPGQRGDPILKNTGREHPIIIVNRAPKDQIGKKAKVKIVKILDRVLIGEYVPEASI